jgi:4-hydroxybenzoate polyprenyltransferase
MKQLYFILMSMRPNQWTKNFVVFAALIFSQNLFNGPLAAKSIEGFLVFCILSGMIYLVNDIADIDKDKLHERKRNRPLASGRLKPATAWAAFFVGTIVAVGVSWLIGHEFFIVVALFLTLNLLYSFVLKKIVLLDVVSISISFVLRAIAGVEVLRSVEPNIEISPWLLICTLFLSLFLAFCKRRHELVTMAAADSHRESLQE